MILFKGTFEENIIKQRQFRHKCFRDELDKRKKEVALLIRKGGFICFLLGDEFLDERGGEDYKADDLAKHHLNYRSLYRENYNLRTTGLKVVSDDFRLFFDRFGAASTYFKNHVSGLEWQQLAKIGQHDVSMIIKRHEYFIPTLIPDNRPEELEEYFRLLATSLTSSFNKIQVSIPEWVSAFQFDEEAGLKSEKGTIESRLEEINDRSEILNRFKSILAFTGDDLVQSVNDIFEIGFRFKTDPIDEFREDIKLLDENSKCFCLCEVKGTNRGIKREHINQTDTHRVSSGFSPTHPALLVVNTSIKHSKNVEEKDVQIANDQILHAVRLGVLLLRTIDLIFFLRLFLSGALDKDKVVDLLTNSTGWLRVSEQGYEVIKEEIKSLKNESNPAQA